MKLYKLYEEVIFEKTLIAESILDDIKSAMDERRNVWIKYQDKDGSISERYIQIYDLGRSKQGNLMISAYQLGGGGGKTSPKMYGWKQFIIDRITALKPTDMRYHKPVSDLASYHGGEPWNPTGNRNMAGSIEKVAFPKFGFGDVKTDEPIDRPAAEPQKPSTRLPKSYYDTEEEDTY